MVTKAKYSFKANAKRQHETICSFCFAPNVFGLSLNKLINLKILLNLTFVDRFKIVKFQKYKKVTN